MSSFNYQASTKLPRKNQKIKGNFFSKDILFLFSQIPNLSKHFIFMNLGKRSGKQNVNKKWGFDEYHDIISSSSKKSFL